MIKSKDDLKPGVILASRWGYNCVRYSFYKIEKVSSSSVWIREIGKKYVTGAPNTPCASVVYDETNCSDKVVVKRITRPKWADGELVIKPGEYKGSLFVADKKMSYNECCD